MDRIDCLRAFVRSLEGGSFSVAANELGIGQPAVSKRIALLESEFGTQLFFRTTRKLKPTPEGHRIYDLARQILGSFDLARANVEENSLRPSGNGRWYDPPVMPKGLADLTRMSPHHSSAINVKRNLLVASFMPTSYLTVSEFSAFVTDYVTFGNAYFERIKAISGRLLRLKRSPAMYTRRGKDGAFWFVPYTELPFAFEPGSLVHLLDTDVTQEIYGVPEYLAALHAAMLNQSATLFRRRYYDNGSHAGFILYVSDPAQSPSDIDAMREALKKSKGPGNFRNLFMYSPNGKKDGIQLIPISEVAAKDDFAAIKNTSRDDILAAHRVPPQLLGVVPVNAGGFGDVDKASAVFMRNEIAPLQARLLGLNDELGVEAIRFKPTDPAATQSA